MPEASHEEIQDLKLQIAQLSVKLDGVQNSLNTVNVALAKQDGANLPSKIEKMELKIEALESVRDSRMWIGDSLVKVQQSVADLERFKYKAIGIITAVQIVASIVISAAVKFGLDALYHSN